MRNIALALVLLLVCGILAGCITSDDDDADGVLNSVDLCPNTPTGETVDADGCSLTQLADDDADGVLNWADLCPNTPTGETVDADGCSQTQLDDDGDGVMNSADLCPNTPTGEIVDADGCSDNGDNYSNCTNNSSGFGVTIALDYTTVPELSNIGGLEYDCYNTTIYGYAWNDSAQEETFISIDPSTGVVTYVETIPNMKYVQLGQSTLSGSDYFALMLDSQNNRFIVHISIANGFPVSTIALDYTNVPELSNIGGIEFDNNSGQIYGYAWNDSAQEETFISIDPSTGVVTYVETIPNMKYVQSGESTLSGSDYFALMLDSQNNRFLVHIGF